MKPNFGTKRVAFNLGATAQQGGFPRSYNQYHGKHKDLYSAWHAGWDKSLAMHGISRQEKLATFMFGEEK